MASTTDSPDTALLSKSNLEKGKSEKSAPLRSWSGRFGNPWPTWQSNAFSLTRVLRFYTTRSHCNIPRSEEELNKVLPVLTPDFGKPAADKLKLTWLGHATVLVQTDNVCVITDPIFEPRASPVSFAGPRRFRPSPCKASELPKLDAVFISHNHHDHLCAETIKRICTHQKLQFGGSGPRFFVPLGLRDWFCRHGVAAEQVFEMDWWESQRFNVATEAGGMFEVHCMPAQHWSTRYLFDKNMSLWCGFALIADKKRFFYSGDTGYCSEFSVIGNQLGPFDAAAIPIGCYDPEWFMHNQHISPAQAVQIHQDVKSRFSLAVHWGTYKMGSCEPFMEPKCKLVEAVMAAKLDSNSFVTADHGQSITV